MTAFVGSKVDDFLLDPLPSKNNAVWSVVPFHESSDPKYKRTQFKSAGLGYTVLM